MGGRHTCVWNVSQAKCWGRNGQGQLGNNTTSTSNVPVDVKFPVGIAQLRTLVAGDSHTCALLVDSQVYCWGNNGDGQLGVAVGPTSLVPVQVGNLGAPDVIAAGGKHTCARDGNDMSLRCFGSNSSHQIDDSNDTQKSTPTLISTPVKPRDQISLGAEHSCYVDQNRDVNCWGRNDLGQLGIGSTANVGTPTKVMLPSATDPKEIRASDQGTCARVSNLVYCWGAGLSGELGNQTETAVATIPVQVFGISDATAIAKGGDGACAIRFSGLSCWGNDTAGKLGLGLGVAAALPQLIAPPPSQ
jgi:alpha-tubulin suppressor-like RCC1 family protein